MLAICKIVLDILFISWIAALACRLTQFSQDKVLERCAMSLEEYLAVLPEFCLPPQSGQQSASEAAPTICLFAKVLCEPGQAAVFLKAFHNSEAKLACVCP